MLSSQLANKLHDPEYRKAFVASQINIGIPFQLRALLKARGKTQEWLAKETGMLQPRISGLLSPGKTRPNIETLRRLAEAFDCGLAVRFVPFGDLASWSETFDPESFSVPSFDDELLQKQIAASTGKALFDSLADYRPRNIVVFPESPAEAYLQEIGRRSDGAERTNQIQIPEIPREYRSPGTKSGVELVLVPKARKGGRRHGRTRKDSKRAA